ncbi:MAG: response regulator [Gammaproteobacteria bacterium]|nr:response regulator [Gammaproteobacteria bacterium]
MDKKRYLLVVDDEEMNLNIIQDLLEDDFELGLASNGQQCLDSVAEKTPDLILLDVNMPVLNGLETCQQLKAGEQTKNIPVVFVSSMASASERMAGYEAGGDEYLTQPFIKTKKLSLN